MQKESEINEKLICLQTLTLNNNFSPTINNISAYNEPNNSKMKEVSNYIKANKSTISSDITNVTDDEKIMFSAKLSIEKLLNKIFQRIGDSYNNRFGIMQMIFELQKMEYIDAITVDSIKQIINVCNSAIHGKVINKVHINFVKETLPFVLNKLQNIKTKEVHLFPITCPRCHYVGQSRYLNVCPKCEFVFVDD